MRSSDRTLLASLGFADPDKGDARHDLACRYLAQPAVAETLAVAEIDRLRAALEAIRLGRYHKYEQDPCPHAEDIAREALENAPEEKPR